MTPQRLREILEKVARGELDASAAFEAVKGLPFEDLGFAKVDHHRELRSGLPEVILGQGKTASQIVAIARRLRDAGQNVLITRIDPENAAAVAADLPEIDYRREARLAMLVQSKPSTSGHGVILVIAAGTSDLPVAEEAALTAEYMGHEVDRLYDVGVAGIHRLFAHKDTIRRASVLIVVAGMEGALPSVVGGFVDRPVIAVPTSVGYGASFGGLAALLGMLNSCAAGVTVVNIDNGFGAAVAAAMINRKDA
jgi:NCAIR mutase (PurE)-related protein